MQKLKKALKKLKKAAGLSKSAGKTERVTKPKPALAAKKATPVKKKTVSAAAGKKAAAPKKAAVAKKASAHGHGKPATKATAKAAAGKAEPKKKVSVAVAPQPTKAAKGTDKHGASAKAGKSERPAEKHAPKKAAVPEAAAPAPTKKAAEKVADKAPVEPETDKAEKQTEKPARAAKAKRTPTTDSFSAPAVADDDEVVLTDAEGRRYCRVKDCDQAAVVDVYCRYHYLLFWKNIQARKKILSEGKLERYIEELTARYPDKYLELLRKDLRSEKDFTAAIQELEIDESGVDTEYEDEAQNYLDEVRGMGGGEAPERDEEF